MSMYPWLEVAMKERGVREVPGRLDNARIVEYARATDYPIPNGYVDEIPWCSMFVNWVFQELDMRRTRSAWSQSWLQWGVSVDEQIGAVVVFSWGGGKGHVGFIWQMDDDGIYVLGGNQKNSVCISYFGRSSIVDYRLPEDYA